MHPDPPRHDRVSVELKKTTPHQDIPGMRASLCQEGPEVCAFFFMGPEIFERLGRNSLFGGGMGTLQRFMAEMEFVALEQVD